MIQQIFKPLKPRPDDSIKMRIAIITLNQARIVCVRKTKWQLKLKNYSYYPDSGKICRDGPEKALRERDLESLMRLLAEDEKADQNIQHAKELQILDLSGFCTDNSVLPTGVLKMDELKNKYGWGRS